MCYEKFLMVVLSVLFCSSVAYAVPIIYYGDTFGGNDGTAPMPNVARTAFMTDLQASPGADYGLENFDALGGGNVLNFEGTSTPLTASISGGTHYNSAWSNLANDIVTISFDREVSAFGMDLLDLGDNHNGMDVILSNGGTIVGTYSMNVARTGLHSNLPSFWGILSDYNFDKITLDLTSNDWYDIDTAVAGNITGLPGSGGGGTAPVPEPATMLLFGTGIVGLAGSKLRKKK